MNWAEFRALEYDEANPLHWTALVACNDEPALPSATTVIRSSAFADALVAQLPGLRRYAVALVSNATLADDLVQAGIERALAQEPQLRDLDRLAGWLRRILHNLSIDEIRRGTRRGREHDIGELTDHLELSVSAPDNSAMLEFIQAVSQLSIEHRQILLLVSVEELSYREIADELGIPLGTVMSRLARARERLRGVLQGETTIVALLPDRKEKA
jgi:RNA polymerase sigma-70 factor, ECF subfamily